MKRIHALTASCAVAAALCCLAPDATAQQISDLHAQSRNQQPELPLATELAMHYFEPQHAPVHELLDVAQLMFGQEILVRSGQRGNVESVQRFLTFGSNLIVQDLAESADKVLMRLRELDSKYEGEGGVATYTSRRYLPRFVSADALLRGLAVIHDEVQWATVPGRQDILLSGESQRVVEALALLAETDRPTPQVTLTCLLIRGSQLGETSESLPGDLVKNLRNLLPMKSFEQVAAGVVRASVDGTSISMQSDAGESLQYQLALVPQAYDEESGVLSLSKCGVDLVEQPAAANGRGAGRPQSQHFSTALSMRAGEYTVLGAVGSDPIFVVLRLVPDRR